MSDKKDIPKAKPPQAPKFPIKKFSVKTIRRQTKRGG
jgi:hypothetical protein